MPWRATVSLPPSPEGSATSTMAWRRASASMRAREDGLPASSSGMNMTVTGMCGRRPVA